MGWSIDRRTFLVSLPALAFVPRLLGRPRPRILTASALNHVELAVSDPVRTLEFYQELFGAPVQARTGDTTILRVGDGPQFMAIRAAEGPEAPSFGRMGIAVEGFDLDEVVAALEVSGLSSAGSSRPQDVEMRYWTLTRRPPGGGDGTRELYIGDPNGLVVQVVDPVHCGGDGPLGSQCGPVEGASTDGLLALRDLNHFTCRVRNPEAANEFYQELFGLPVQAYQAATPALGIAGGPQFLMFIAGGTDVDGTIDHLCMTVERFEPDRILATLADFGIQPRREGEGPNVPFRSSVSMRMPNRGGAPEGTPELYFTDPDGLRVQLQDPTYCGGGGVLGDLC